MSSYRRLKGVFSNKIIGFVLSRYLTYFIQFVNSLFIAVYLGPYYLGIWGFINLIIQYFAQLNFGISSSALALGAINKNHKRYTQIIFSNAIGMMIILSFAASLVFLLIYFLKIPFGDKYEFRNYMLIVLSIGILNYFNSLLQNFFRLMGKLREVAFSQSIMPVLFLGTILLFKKEALLNALVYANLVAFSVSFILFIVNCPIKLAASFQLKVVRIIQRKGIFLFLYNTSFYLIIISTRTFISAFYEVKEFGVFTFSYSLANIFLLLLESFSFLLLPKAISKFSKSSAIEAKLILDKLRSVYIVTAHFLIHLGCLIFPIFLILFFPKYGGSADSFRLIALSIVVYTNTFGIQSLLVSKGYEKRLGYISFAALAINILLLFVFVVVLKVSSNMVILSTLITYFIYCLLLAINGQKALYGANAQMKIKEILSIFPVNLFIPYVVSLGLIFAHSSNYFYFIPVIIFLVLNLKDFKQIKAIALQLLNNPDKLDT